MKLADRLAVKYAKELEKLGVSDTFELLGKPATLPELVKLTEKKHMPPKAAQRIAQDKFNQLVAPYLNMKPVSLAMGGDLEMFLHDLIHEAIREGSVAEFNIKDKDKSKSYFDKYDLKDHVDEAIAERLTSGSGASQFSDTLDRLPHRVNVVGIKDQSKFADVIQADLQSQLRFFYGFKQGPVVKKIFGHLVNFIRHDAALKELIDLAIDVGYTTLSGPWFKVFMAIKDKATSLFDKIVQVPNKSIVEDERAASLLRRWISVLKVIYTNWEYPVKESVAQLAQKFIEKYGADHWGTSERGNAFPAPRDWAPGKIVWDREELSKAVFISYDHVRSTSEEDYALVHYMNHDDSLDDLMIMNDGHNTTNTHSVPLRQLLPLEKKRK